jgi:hypothetical protein
MKRLPFTIWFAARDLFRPIFNHVTCSVAFTIACLAALAILMLGLFNGYEAVFRYRTSVALTVGNPRLSDLRFTDDKLTALRARLSKELGPEVFITCEPYLLVEGEVFMLSPSRRQESNPIQGRTVTDAGDTLLQTLELSSGVGFNAAREAGLIVSPKLLEELQHPGGDLTSLRVRQLGTAGGEPFEVPIVGVSRHDLPGGAGFLICESYYQTLLEVRSNQPLMRVQANPLPEKFDPELLPEPARKYLNRQGVVAELVMNQGRTVCEFRKQDSWDPVVWKDFLATLSNHLSAYSSYGKGPFFTNVVPLDMPAQTRTALGPYHYVNIYIRDPQQLERTLAIAKPFPPARDLEDRLRILGSLAALGRYLMAIMLFAVLVVGAVALGTMHGLRAAQKQTEIGLLKSMGIPSASLRMIFVWEGFSLWLIGFVVAACVAIPLGTVLGGYALASDAAERSHVFPWITPLVATGVATLVVSVTSAWIATRAARRRSPIESFAAN